MSAANAPREDGQRASVSDAARLAEATHDLAARLYAAVAEAYLEFRRRYCHESDPSLATIPPRSDEAQQTEGAHLAQGTLRLIPREAHAVPLVRDLMDQLQWVVDIHTLTGTERMRLHNLTMIFLYGVKDGIQAWYVEWLLESAHALAHVTNAKYYLAFPWQALLYRKPHDLAAFEAAVRAGDVAEIGREVQQMAEHLVTVLRDPLGTQPKLAFAGPDGEQRKLIFDLKTAAGLALGAYLAAETVHALMHPHQTAEPLRSAIGLPPQLTPQVISEEGA